MDRTKLLKHLVFLMFFIFVADFIAQKFYLYTSIWYFDMFMHFGGGFWEGLLFLWFFPLLNLPFFHLSIEKIDLKLICKTISFVLMIGILWEVFEIYTHNYLGHDPFNILDTASDIFFDLAGGFMAVLYFVKRIMVFKENKVE